MSTRSIGIYGHSLIEYQENYAHQIQEKEYKRLLCQLLEERLDEGYTEVYAVCGDTVALWLAEFVIEKKLSDPSSNIRFTALVPASCKKDVTTIDHWRRILKKDDQPEPFSMDEAVMNTLKFMLRLCDRLFIVATGEEQNEVKPQYCSIRTAVDSYVPSEIISEYLTGKQ